MTFEVPEANASKEQDQFKFKIPGFTQTFSVKRAKFLPIELAEKIANDGDAAFEFLGKRGTKQGEAIRSLNQGQYAALVQAWYADSQVTLGESGASSTS